MEIKHSKKLKLNVNVTIHEYHTLRNIQDPEKPKSPTKKAAKRKAGEKFTYEEEKENQGVGNDTPAKKRKMVDPDKPKAPAKKAAKSKAGAASTIKGGKINQDEPNVLAKKAAKPKPDVTQHTKPSKKCVKGYIHNVSEVVLSANKNKYFTALFQEAKTCSKLVVFEEEHHQDFVTAEKNLTPVKLENIKYERQRTGEKDIVAGWDSKLSYLRKLPFSFDATKKQETNTEHKTIRTILKNPINNQRVHVAVLIKKEQRNGKAVTRAKKTLPMTVYAVSDKSGSLDLTVWGKKNLSVGKWYLLGNLSVRKFQGKTTLTTTPQTTIKEVAEAEAAVSFTHPANKGVKEVQRCAGGEQAKKRKMASTKKTTGLALNIHVTGGSTVNVPVIKDTEATNMTLTANMNNSNK